MNVHFIMSTLERLESEINMDNLNRKNAPTDPKQKQKQANAWKVTAKWLQIVENEAFLNHTDTAVHHIHATFVFFYIISNYPLRFTFESASTFIVTQLSLLSNDALTIVGLLFPAKNSQF